MATRIITIVCRGGNDFDVHEGEAYAPRLCWDEMLGQIASLTHPDIDKPRYRPWTPEERQAYEERIATMRGESLANIASIENSPPEVSR